MVVRENNHLIKELNLRANTMKVGVSNILHESRYVINTGLETWNNEIGKNG